ncbi:hypothetical protein AB6D11_06055 [Vibrio splendidus]
MIFSANSVMIKTIMNQQACQQTTTVDQDMSMQMFYRESMKMVNELCNSIESSGLNHPDLEFVAANARAKAAGLACSHDLFARTLENKHLETTATINNNAKHMVIEQNNVVCLSQRRSRK